MKFGLRSDWRGSLLAKVVLFLSLTLLPIGFIAIFQTRELTRESDLRNDLALLALTETATTREVQLVERAFGAAQMLAATADAISSNPDVCRTFFAQFLRDNDAYSFVGLLPTDGRVDCTSDGTAYDVSNSPKFQKLIAEATPKVDTNQVGSVGARSVLSVNQPYFRDGALKGFVSIAIPQARIAEPAVPDELAQGVQYVTFNAAGEILTTTESLLQLAPMLPAGTDLTTFIGKEPQVFTTQSRDGESREFGMVPIVPERIYALSIWTADLPLTPSLSPSFTATLFPFFMLIASIFVATFALNRLVIRHVQGLRRKMRQFAHDRRIDPQDTTISMPAEFADMQADFEAMAHSLSQDEAELQDTLHNNQQLVKEKDLLLKELHHRVKNNLQMISSIMNMQIRQTANHETEEALRRLQDRVMTLATVHRNLYPSTSFEAVNVGPMLRALVRQMLLVGRGGEVHTTLNIEDLDIYRDQAMSLALLVSEAVTGALNAVADAEMGKPWLSVALTAEGAFVTLSVEYSAPATTDGERRDLGAQLIEAFASQLDADLRVEKDDDRLALVLVFQKSEISPELTDH